MSESAFNEAAEAAAQEDADLEIPEEGAQADLDGEGEQPEAKATDWEKKAHDKEGQAARERSRRRAAEKSNRELAERLEKLEAKGGDADGDQLAALLKELRDDDEDPISDLAGLKKLARRMIEREEAETQQTAAQRQQQRAVQALVSTMEEHEADFAEAHPDYPKAAAHYREQRKDELEEMGYSGQELNAALAKDMFGVVQRALGAGKDPAEAVYNLSKKRGFVVGADTTGAKLDKIAGAAASGVRPGGAKAGPGTLTWSAVAAMKGADRDKAFEKLRQQERRAG